MKKIFVLLIILIPLSGCIDESDLITTNTGSTIEKICIEGHVYYKTIGFYEGGIAPKLDDNGKPVPCENEDYK